MHRFQKLLLICIAVCLTTLVALGVLANYLAQNYAQESRRLLTEASENFRIPEGAAPPSAYIDPALTERTDTRKMR